MTTTSNPDQGSRTVEVVALRYTKAELMAAPEKARTFYLLATGLSNDLQILTRQYAIALKQWDENEAKKAGSAAVAFLNLRLLAGRLHEGWELIHGHWKAVSHDFEADLSQEGLDALAELKAYFSKPKPKNLVFMMRNKIGFHADWGHAKATFSAIDDHIQMTEYLGRSMGHTLYNGVEGMHYQTIRSLTGISDELSAYESLMDGIRLLGRHFMTFVFAYVRVFVQRHLSTNYDASLKDWVTLTDLPDFNGLQIPFFAIFPVAPGATS